MLMQYLKNTGFCIWNETHEDWGGEHEDFLALNNIFYLRNLSRL